jgi:hypothetical protein
MRSAAGVSLVVVAAMLGGCIDATPAPGAEQVKITHEPADVVGCTPAGNLALAYNPFYPNLTKDEAVGMSANVVLLTGGFPIAYRCNGAPPVTQCPANCAAAPADTAPNPPTASPR